MNIFDVVFKVNESLERDGYKLPYKIVKKNGTDWVCIPAYLFGVYTGVVSRRVDEKWYVNRAVHKPMFYTAVRGLMRREEFRYGMPIILTEGWSDAEYISQFYPFVVSLLGANVSYEKLIYLASLTYSFVIAFDNDEAGKKATNILIGMLRKVLSLPHIQVCEPPFDKKDWGECWFDDSARKFAEVVFNNVD